ncbi:MAG: Dabb family protein [Phycisphaeraceae bacterium]
MLRLFAILLAVATFAGCKSSSCCDDVCDDDVAATHLGHLRHVVLFKFKEGTMPEKIAEIEKAFAALPAKIPSIIDFEWGTNNSPEEHAQGYTHCFLVTFKDAAGRAAYLPHPAHNEFVALAGPHFDAVHVVDYVAKK